MAARGRDEYNHTALTAAACKGHVEIVDLLLEHSAEIDASTKYRVSLLLLMILWNSSSSALLSSVIKHCVWSERVVLVGHFRLPTNLLN